jgi:hypothetical protein
VKVDEVLPVLLELELELELEELLDPETVTGSRIVESALLIVLIFAQTVRAGDGLRPGPRFVAGGIYPPAVRILATGPSRG